MFFVEIAVSSLLAPLAPLALSLSARTIHVLIYFYCPEGGECTPHILHPLAERLTKQLPLSVILPGASLDAVLDADVHAGSDGCLDVLG